MNLNHYLASQRDLSDERVLTNYLVPLAKRITCADGFSLSVQASYGAYCTPRTNVGPWSEVEVGYPSSAPEFIRDYAEEADSPTGTIYPYVPIELVEQLIELHGGPVTR